MSFSSITQSVEQWRAWSASIKEIAGWHRKEEGWLRAVAGKFDAAVDGRHTQSRIEEDGRLTFFGARESWDKLAWTVRAFPVCHGITEDIWKMNPNQLEADYE